MRLLQGWYANENHRKKVDIHETTALQPHYNLTIFAGYVNS